MTIGALLGFAGLHLYAIAHAMGGNLPPNATTPEMINFAAGLTGLVSGVVAVAFGVKPKTGTSAADPGASRWRAPIHALGSMTGLTSSDDPSPHPVRDFLIVGYVLVYLVTGALAGLALLFANVGVAPQTRSLALITLGVVIAIANRELTE